MKSKKKCKKKLFKKIIFIIQLLISIIYYIYNKGKLHFLNPKMNENVVKIFILAHKDFKNYRFNPVYNIVVDEKSQLKDNYNLNVLYANEGKLFNLKKAYCEMGKLYYIYQLYLNRTFSTKYIGFNHYRRYFDFGDNIPDLDYIFNNYDIILINKYKIKETVRAQFCHFHICSKFDQILDIIKEIKPDYYEAALKVSIGTELYLCNIFIMKKEDFFKYCEFMFDILFEFDKRHNFKTVKDIEVYMKQYFEEKEALFQVRVQGFLSERISTIFYHKYFNSSRIKIIGMAGGFPKSKKRQSIIDKFSHKNKVEVIIEGINYIKIIVVLVILSMLFIFIVLRIRNKINKRKEIKKTFKKSSIKSKLKKQKNIFFSSDEKSNFNI